MRFFSRAWASHSDNRHVESVVADYEAHLASLQGRVGSKIRAWSNGRSRSLHDGLLDHLLIVTSTQTMCLSLIIGDNQVGYAELQISYHGAEIVLPNLKLLRSAFQTRNVQILYDEFDIEPDRSVSHFCHRLLLWPEEFGEIVIRFDDLDVSETSISQRGYATFGEALEIEMYPSGTE